MTLQAKLCISYTWVQIVTMTPKHSERTPSTSPDSLKNRLSSALIIPIPASKCWRSCGVHTPPCVSFLNVQTKTARAALKPGHLSRRNFNQVPPREKQAAGTPTWDSLPALPRPGQSRRRIPTIPDKIVRGYPPGCDDTLRYSRRIDGEADVRGLCGGRGGWWTAPTCVMIPHSGHPTSPDACE